MGVETFLEDPGRAREFVRLAHGLYRDDSRWIAPSDREMLSRLSPSFAPYSRPGSAVRHFLARSRGTVVGRVSALVNPTLRDTHAQPVGSIGYFECIEDESVAEELLGQASAWLRDSHGLRRVWGPLNFDIWHGYRLMTRGFGEETFTGEPYNKPYYPELFEHCGFRALQHWDSVEVSGREALEELAAPGAKRYRLLSRQGYRFVPIDMRRFPGELRKLHRLLTRCFARFLGMTPVSMEEFQRLYSHARPVILPDLFCFIQDGDGALVGFIGSFPDLADAVRVMRGRSHVMAKLRFLLRSFRRADRVIFYIGGILPEEQQRASGLGRAAFHYEIRRILDAGYERVVVALMARGNPVQGLLKRFAATAQRQYTLYEWTSCRTP